MSIKRRLGRERKPVIVRHLRLLALLVFLSYSSIFYSWNIVAPAMEGTIGASLTKANSTVDATNIRFNLESGGDGFGDLFISDGEYVYLNAKARWQSISGDTIVTKITKIGKGNASRPRVLLFITTHMSQQHMWYLKSCWPQALLHSPLLRNADVMVYLNTEVKRRNDALRLLSSVFINQQITVHIRSKESNISGAKAKHAGAIAALSDAARLRWFDSYDWVIRLNPDVIVRNSTYLSHTINNDPAATAILINCLNFEKPRRVQVHTDFFAIKPGVLPKDAFLNPSDGNAEMSFTHDIKKSVLEKGGHRWIPEAFPYDKFCRAGYKRVLTDTPIIHFHFDETTFKNFTCPVPFVTDIEYNLH